MRSLLLALPVVVLLVASPTTASAYDFTIDSRTALQVYDVAGPGGEPTLARRRVLQTLRLGAHGFVPAERGAPRLNVVVALRLDSDFGVESRETDSDELSSGYVPGLQAHDVDLTYAWIDGQGFLGGWLDFRVGRQFEVDALGWYAFDGGLVRVRTPWWIQAEVFGGLEVRGAFPLSPSTFELDGTQRASRDGLDPSTYPSIEEPAVAPVFGAALESHSLMWVHGRLVFREVQSEGRVQQRRLGYSASLTPIERLTIRGSFVYDLHLSFASEATGGVEVEVSPPLVVGAEFVHFTPTFDADSIWNFFPIEPMNDLRLRAQIAVVEGLDVSALVFGRLFSAEETDAAPDADTVTDLGGAVSVRGWNRVSELQIRVHVADGQAGSRLGADLWGLRRLWNDKLAATARLSVWRWEDELRVDREGLSVAGVLGAEYRFSRPAKLLVELEDDVNEVVGQRFRLLALLDLRFEP